jgi:hypothetical protein
MSEGQPTGADYGPGVSEDDVLQAVLKSGYPLQVSAIDRITAALDEVSLQNDSWPTTVQEEWSFLDPDEGKVRHLDAFVTHSLARSDELVTAAGHILDPGGCFRFHLDLLVECQQSDLPYIFFLRETPHGKIPRLIGLPHPQLKFELPQEQGGPFAFRMSAYDALELFDLDLELKVPTAIALRRIRRNGKRLELSGDEVYRELTLPITKAHEYYAAKIEADGATSRLYFDVHHICLVAVLRAPMVGVRTAGEEVTLETVPWVRVVRIDPGSDRHQTFSVVTAIDAVHIDNLTEYVSRMHAITVEASRRITGSAIALLEGEAISGGLSLKFDESDDPGFVALGSAKSNEEFVQEWWVRFREVHSRSEDQ